MSSEKRLTLGIFAPSAAVDLPDEVVGAGLARLLNLGFRISPLSSFKDVSDFTAGLAVTRAKTFMDLAQEPTIDIIMAFWGGRNTNEILSLIDYEKIKNSSKIIIGYSDTTILLNTLSEKCEIVTFLGPSVISFCKPVLFDETNTSLKAAINQHRNKNRDHLSIEIPKYYASDSFQNNPDNKREIKENEGWKVIRPGVVENKRVVALTLSSLIGVMGTEYEPNFDDAVFFCEADESIKPEMLNQFIAQLSISKQGIFDKICGFVFSKLMDESEISEEFLIKVIEAFLKKDIPIIINFDAGHTDPILTLPIGGLCTIDAKTADNQPGISFIYSKI